MHAQSSSAPIIRLEHAQVRIAGRPILFDVDWQLDPRTHWGVIGANGSGKTSFLGLLAGSLWPAPGGGRRLYDFGAGSQTDAVQARQQIALVGHELQNRYTRFGWNFKAVDIVLSGLTRTDIPRRHPRAVDRARALALLQEFGLEKLAQRRLLELSRGQQRRVLIARSMAFAPAVLLLDEPASGLDRQARAELAAMIERVMETTQVLVSGHRDADLPGGLTHLLEFDAGRMVYQGPRSAQRAATAFRHAETTNAGTAPANRRGADVLIEVRDADVWLGDRRVLHDINLSLRAGEQWLIQGPNGAGKSTLLRLLHGQLRPARGGSISWPGLGNPKNVWELRRQIGHVSAELHAAYRYPTSVADAIASGFTSSIGRTKRLTAAERARVDELIRSFELQGLENRLLSTLSYGQMHRALIARTLANRPRILLLDEPWEGLDSPTRELLKQRLTALMAQGTQLVLSSHIGGLGLPFTREIELDAGRILNGGASAAPRQSSASVPSPG